jgi:uncharacterized protein YciI
MPEFIYRIVPARAGMLAGGPTLREARVVDEHFAYLERLTDERRVLMAGRTLTDDERSFGIVVFVAESDAAARDLVDHDPAVRAGVMTAELWPFRVALWSAAAWGDPAGGA